MRAEEQARQAQAADFEKKTQDLTNGLSLTNTAVAANTAALEKNTQSIEQNTARIGKLEDKVDDNTYGIAMSMAMSALPPAYSVGEFNVAAGVGHFDGKSAVAVGMGYRMSEQVSLKASVGHAGSKLGASAGVSYSF